MKTSCFTAPSQQIQEMLAGYPAVLKKVIPLKAAHWRDLHYAIRDLSKALTSERGGMKSNYWSSPRSKSAYLHFFLPWNLYRMAWLLPNLDLAFEDGDTILDLGSGPCTFVQALWIARPDLRDLKLNFVCADVAKQPMEAGRDLFEAMAPNSKWRIKLVRETIDKALRNHYGRAKLVTGSNVLNELRTGRGQTLEDRTFDIAQGLSAACAEGGSVLCIEPGTRLGGKMISLTRQGLLDHDFFPAAPCPHDTECPMLEKRSTSWCHFNMPAAHVPDWLRDLSHKARIDRRSVSVSFLHATPERPEYDDAVRVLSEPILIPGVDDKARYACSPKGLALLHDAGPFHSGSVVQADYPEPPQFDEKSRAREIYPARRKK